MGWWVIEGWGDRAASRHELCVRAVDRNWTQGKAVSLTAPNKIIHARKSESSVLDTAFGVRIPVMLKGGGRAWVEAR